MLLPEFLLLTLLWFVNGEEKKDPRNMTYLYLQMPNNMPLKDQYPQRVGFARGTLGTRKLPVIWPPEKNLDPLSLITLYRPRKDNTKDLKAFCSSGSAHDVTQITSFMHWFVQQKLDALLVHSKASGQMMKLSAPFIATVPAARLEFITFYCLLRHNPRVEQVNKFGLKLTAQPYPDTYRFCPSVCADREGPGMDSTERALLTRYSKPCSYPSDRLLFTSRKCVDSQPVSVVHQEAFRCSCQGNARWHDQLKTCHFCLHTGDKAASSGDTKGDVKGEQKQKEGAAKTKKNTAQSLTEPLDCHREGTQYVGGVGLDAQTGGDEVIRSKHQILRCVCKPQYHGSRCDKLKDPCLMPIGTALPGNVACNTNDRENTCIPDFEQSRYTCKCGDNYRRIDWAKSLPPGRLLDNCLRQRDPCAVQGCMHGTCVLSDLGSTMEYQGKQRREPFMWLGRAPQIVARCLCNAGWTGEKCSFPLVLNGWSPWSPWTACEPSCQSSIRELPPYGQQEMVESSQSTPRWGVRQRTRYRDCMGDASDCREEIRERSSSMGLNMVDGKSWRQYERRACRPRPCDRHLYLAMGKRAVRRSKIMRQVRETLKQAYTVHLWTVLAFTFVFAIFGFVAAFATKMHSEKVYEAEVSRDISHSRSR